VSNNCNDSIDGKSSNNLPDVQNKRCFETCRDQSLTCTKRSCRYWLKGQKEHQNCTLIAAGNGPWTLQKVGEFVGLTRMRVCQIEKSAISKIEKILHGK
jgi:hypothetical protein